MFDRLRKKVETAARGDDCVWLSDATRIEGMCREADESVAGGRSLVVVTSTLTAFESMADALAPHAPLLCRDMLRRDTLRRSLESGAAIAVAMPAALPGEAEGESNIQADVLVYGRSDARSADDAILRATDALRPGVYVTFHLSLDDTLLQPHLAALKPLLETLGTVAQEPVTSPFLTRAIANAQTE